MSYIKITRYMWGAHTLVDMDREVRRLGKEVIRVARLVYLRGLTPGNSGNISVRIPGVNAMVIKASGSSFRSMGINDLVVMDFNGNVLVGSKKPSIEYRMHLGIYRIRSDVNAVIHVHPPYSTLYAVLGKTMPLLTSQAESDLRKIPVIEYAPPGSRELAELVVNAYRDKSVRTVLLKNHGVVAVGKQLEDALNIIELLEDTARISLYYELLARLNPGR